MMIVCGSREAIMARQPEEVFNFWWEMKFPNPIKGGYKGCGE